MNTKLRVTFATGILALVALAAPTFAGPIGQDTVPTTGCTPVPLGPLDAPVCGGANSAANSADTLGGTVCTTATSTDDCSGQPDTTVVTGQPCPPNTTGTSVGDGCTPNTPGALPPECDPTGAGSPTSQACFDALTNGPTPCPAPTVGDSLPNCGPDLSALTAGCTQPVPGPTVATQAQAFLGCVALNVQTLVTDTVGPIADSAIEAICGVFATATSTDAQDCIDAINASNTTYFTDTLQATANGKVCTALGNASGTSAQSCAQAKIDATVCGTLPAASPTHTAATDCVNDQLAAAQAAIYPVEHQLAPSQFNKQPVANAGPDQAVFEGTVVHLAGAFTDGDAADTHTYAWTCPAGISLSSATAQNPQFTAPAQASGSHVYDCTLVVTDNSGAANKASTADHVLVTVNHIIPPLAITVSIDPLATQQANNYVLLTGTATPNLDAANVPITIGVQNSPATGAACTNTPNIVWNGNLDHADLSAGVARGFNAYVCWTTNEQVIFRVTIGSSPGFAQDATVPFGSSAGSSMAVGVSDVDATIAAGALTPNTYSPDGLATQAISSVIAISDGNGPGGGAGSSSDGRISDANLAVALANGADSTALTQSAGSDVSATERDITVGGTLPANLKDTTYTMTAGYTNWSSTVVTDATRTLAVANVAPTISVTPGTPVGTERVAGTQNVVVTLKDANIGTLQGTPVTELSGFAVSFHSANDCTGSPASVLGLTVGFSGLPTGAAAGFTSVNYATTALTGGQTTLTLAVNWASTIVADTYYVCGSVTDDNAASSGNVLLATLQISAINAGFHITVSDGGNGLSTATPIEPNAPATTTGLRVLLSGTLDAQELDFAVGTFSDGTHTFVAQSVTGKLCLSSTLVDCSGANLLGDGTASSGTVAFVHGTGGNLAANLAHGVPVYAFFSFTVPDGTAKGSYSAPITVTGVAA